MSTEQDYVDIRELHNDYQHRACPCCEAEWYYTQGSSRGTYCPYCQCKPLFRRLAKTYGPHYLEAQREDDSNLAPPPYHHRIPTAMAYEASQILGFEVNHFHCMHYIWNWLPEDEPHSKAEEPDTKTVRAPDKIIKPPADSSQSGSDSS